MRRRIVFMLAAGGLVVAAFALTRSRARAQAVPDPCDFITGGGFVFTDDGARANFGAHGGCKNGSFWGHVNYVDHDPTLDPSPYHVDSIEITGYLTVPGFPNARDICGVARTNAGETVDFRVRMEDNGEGTDAPKDRFGIRLSNGYLVSTRPLGDDGAGGGNVKLHDHNPSNTPPEEAAVCLVPAPEPTPPGS
ncbi:MAG: hypothetical protein DMF82_15120 [Acidobacteria bacterium]|nr:MAG: hypothetical protein DMF82_15120 [Acidobacteriota bacterium]